MTQPQEKKQAQAFVGGPRKKKPSKEEAAKMADALFDSMARQRAAEARKKP